MQKHIPLSAAAVMLAGALTFAARAKAQIAPGTLDPGRNAAALQAPVPTTLTEQFIWTQGDAAALDPAQQAKVRGQQDKIAPHFFRAHFKVDGRPPQSTLYIAGPRSATVFLNGKQVVQFQDGAGSSKGFRVTVAEVAGALRQGDNVIAVEEVRGHSSLHTGASPTINQVTYGEVLALKIVPRSVGIDAAPLVVTDGSWRSTLNPPGEWTAAAFDEGSWPLVQTLGVIGGKSDFLQWNADAGLYAWPGYSGLGAAMRTFRIQAVAVRDEVNPARVSPHRALGEFSIAPGGATSFTLDFGREVSGRVHLVSASDKAVTVATSYGESAEEANGHAYLGVREVTVPANGEAFGPKSAFRYVRLTFPAEASRWEQIDVEGITYPVEYLGAFESSDPVLNRIWETGAYTAHLCMQEGIWDAPKRDRGRWMGDLDVTGRVISSVFADRTLMEATMSQVIGDSPVRRDVNTIAGYSALWITGQADFYRHLGDLDYLRSVHEQMLELLGVMDVELDGHGLFTNPGKHKVFVDWSDGFNSDTPEARAATHLEFYLAYQEASYLLEEMGDVAHAAQYKDRARLLQRAAQGSLVSHANTFGDRWQTNAMAVVSGAADEAQQAAIWSQILTHVADKTSSDVVTPYYGFYVLSAMARLDHRAEALQWMRQYWGGMLDEGATSFWEAYDPHWPNTDFHASLEADNKKGYYVSLAHGWASGPTAWLMQQVLGIEPTGRGFSDVKIRPELAGLAWARGAEPTPRGLIRVDVKPRVVEVEIPSGTRATVSLPFAYRANSMTVNDRPAVASSDEGGRRSLVRLDHAGKFRFTSKETKF